MKLPRSFRFVAAAATLFSMLFMQLAVAAYACPTLSMNRDSQVMSASARHMPDREMTACHDMDPVQPSLCHAYGQVGKQSLDKPSVPVLPPFIAVGFGLPISPLEVTDGPDFIPPEITILTRATAPPVAIRNCCFRI